jgi:hypothetical protein
MGWVEWVVTTTKSSHYCFSRNVKGVGSIYGKHWSFGGVNYSKKSAITPLFFFGGPATISREIAKIVVCSV